MENNLHFDKLDQPDRFRNVRLFVDFFSLILSIIALIISLLGYLNTFENTSITNKIQATELLDKAWDLLGGGIEGTHEIDPVNFTQSPYDIEKASRNIIRAKELAPDLAKVYWTESSLAYKKGNFEKSIALNRKAIQLDPTSSIPHDKLGMVLASQQKFDEAEAEFKQAAQLDAYDPSPLCNLCYVHRILGKLSEASGECEQALKVDPTWQDTYINLAAIRLDQGRAPEAQELLRKLKELKSSYRASGINARQPQANN